MLNIITTLSQEKTQQISQYLEETYTDSLEKDVSSYAPGRARSWLEYEAPLSDIMTFGQAIKDERLWTFITKLCAKFNWQPELGLMSRGGVISKHRDASYADFRSIGINLGKVTWCYEKIYPAFGWVPSEQTIDPPEVTKIQMTGGEIFEFNCKNPHWTEDVDPTRWGINLWRVSNRKRKEFENYKNPNYLEQF